jgi:hypothetical protein
MAMETARMQASVRVLALLLATTVAHAGEVYKSTDAQGRPIYTDKPPTLPAERMDVKTATTDTVQVRERYDAQMQRNAEKEAAATKARESAANQKAADALTSEDRAKRCQDARTRYEKLYNSWRLYEAGPTAGERRYLSAEEIDAARTNAKQVMDEFCGER